MAHRLEQMFEARAIMNMLHNACGQRTDGWARLLPPAKGVNTQRVRCTALLDGGVTIRAQNKIDASLISRALRFEPLKDISINS